MNKLLKIFLLISLFIIQTNSYALFTHNQNILPAEQAFKITELQLDKNKININWQIADHTYLYKQFIKVTTNDNRNSLTSLALPEGKNKQDEIFGKYQIYQHNLTAQAIFSKEFTADSKIDISFQGCSDSGFCYPPMHKSYQIKNQQLVLQNINQPSYGANRLLNTNNQAISSVAASQAAMSPINNSLENSIKQQSLVHSLWLFLGLGLLLAFTPCVLPMVPILSSIILGHRERLATSKAFLLSLSYVIGMALSYALMGFTIGYIGQTLQSYLQQPWVIISFAAVFIVLALSQFQLLHSHLPIGLSGGLNKLISKIKGGKIFSVTLMGGLSALVVSPCVTPALVGALAYISHTGNATTGALLLAALGFGMGLPLILVGILGAKFLPKTGTWMQTVSNFFGVLLLAIAIWLLGRVLPENITLILWSLLITCCAIFLGALDKPLNKTQKLLKGCGVFALFYAFALFIGALSGNNNWRQPLTNLVSAKQVSKQTIFKAEVTTLPSLQSSLALVPQNSTVLLDFYADWCTSCQKIEGTVLTHPKVQQALNGYYLIRVNITKQNPASQALMQKFKVYAPPVFIRMNKDLTAADTDFNNWHESSARLIGEVDIAEFLNWLK